jgi:hypothetical protein
MQDIKHFLQYSIADVHIQSTAVTINTNHDNITLLVIYSSPKQKITIQQYESFFKSLGNAKHKLWGSKTNTPRVKILE